MPTFKITDPTTKKTIKITGDTVPTEQEIDEIFSKYGSATPKKSFLDQAESLVGNLISPSTVKLGEGLSGSIEANLMGGTQRREQDTQSAIKTTDTLLKKLQEAKAKGDTEQITFLSNAIQQILGTQSQESKQYTQNLQQGKTQATKALPGFVTDISLAALGGKIPQAATAGGRIGQAAVTQGARGATTGLALSQEGQELQGTAIGGLTGATLGAALQGGAEILKSGSKKLQDYAAKKAVEKAQTGDLSDKISQIKLKSRSGESTLQDKIRSGEFLKYKNKSNSLIDQDEVAKVLDATKLKYKSTNDLSGQANKLSAAIQEGKEVALADMEKNGVLIDVANASKPYDDVISSSMVDNAKAKKVFDGLVKITTGEDLNGISPLKADKIASEIGNEARTYYKASFDAQGNVTNVDNYKMYQALNAAKNYIRDQIDTSGAEIAFSKVANNASIQKIKELAPALYDSLVKNKISLADANYIQAMMSNASSLAKDTNIALMGAGKSVLDKNIISNIPVIGQVTDVANQAIDVITNPLKANVRSGTSKLVSSLISSVPTKTAAISAKPLSYLSNILSQSKTPATNIATRFTIERK